MNETNNDNGLRRAAQAEPRFRLPADFTFHTLRRVEEETARRERRRERILLWAVCGAAAMMVSGSLAGYYFLTGSNPLTGLAGLFRAGVEGFAHFSLPLLPVACGTVLLLIDGWVRRRFFRHRSEA